MDTDHEMNRAAIQFYLPYQREGIKRLPDRIEDYWAWIVAHRSAGEGRYSWTLHTFLQLQRAGVACVLVTEFPASGIVIAHRDFLPVFLRPRADVFLVCIKPDRKEHTWAQHYLVQNRNDPAVALVGGDRVTEMLHWPQPSLRPRDGDRGTRCENVAYFGRTLNLAPELSDAKWAQELAQLGFRWLTPSLEHWNDYREVDITVSVRSFGPAPNDVSAILDPNSKPPTKLTNSWLAGVPAVVGAEPSFQNIRRHTLDFIEVTSTDALKQALITLRDNPTLYDEMRTHGWRRADEFSVNAVQVHWREVIAKRIVPSHEMWIRQSRWSRQLRCLARVVAYFLRWRNVADLLAVAGRMIRAPKVRRR